MLCEKPLANTVAEAEEMAAAAARGGGARASTRCAASPTGGRRPWRWPSELIDEGRIGTVRHVRAQYLQDWLHDAERPDDLAAGQEPSRAPARSATSAPTSSTPPSG